MFYTPRVEIPAKPASRWLALAIALIALLVVKLNQRQRANKTGIAPMPETPPRTHRIRGDSQELRA